MLGVNSIAYLAQVVFKIVYVLVEYCILSIMTDLYILSSETQQQGKIYSLFRILYVINHTGTSYSSPRKVRLFCLCRILIQCVQSVLFNFQPNTLLIVRSRKNVLCFLLEIFVSVHRFDNTSSIYSYQTRLRVLWIYCCCLLVSLFFDKEGLLLDIPLAIYSGRNRYY